MPTIKNIGERPYTINRRGGFDKEKNTPIVKKYKFFPGDPEVEVSDSELEDLRESELFCSAVDGRERYVTVVKDEKNDKGETVFVKKKEKRTERPDLLVKGAKPRKSAAEKKDEISEEIKKLGGNLPPKSSSLKAFKEVLAEAKKKAADKK